MTSDREQVAKIAAQIGSSVMPDNKVWTNRFSVQSCTSSSVYTVAQRRTDGVWGCSCRGWINYKQCKHLKDVLHRLSDLAEQEALHPAVLDMLRSARNAHLDLGGSTPIRQRGTSTRLLDM